MFKTALVGIDLSPAENSLLSCLPDLQRWGIEAVILAHVIPVGRSQGAGFAHAADYTAWLERHAAPLRAAGLHVSVAVVHGAAVAQDLLDLAPPHRADLVVVGSRSHNFLSALFLGSVAREVLRRTALPVLVQRLDPRQAGRPESCAAVCQRALERVLLATDLSPQSRAAEQVASELAAQTDQIDCLTVLPPEIGASERRATERAMGALANTLRQAGGTTEVRIVEGQPVESIAAAGHDGYSLIIVGKHGRHWTVDKLIGSTAAKLSEIAGRPVLMVPVAT